jgi:hypothetical protein
MKKIIVFFENIVRRIIFYYYCKLEFNFEGINVYKLKRKIGGKTLSFFVKILKKNTLTPEQIMYFCEKHKEVIKDDKLQIFVRGAEKEYYLVNLYKQEDKLTLSADKNDGVWDSGQGFAFLKS